MKILFHGNGSSPHLRRWMSFFIAQGWEAWFIGDCRTLADPPPGLRLVDFRSGGLLTRLAHAIRYRQLLRRERPDVINFHYIGTSALYAFLAGDIPVVLSGWGDDFLIDPVLSWWKRLRLRLLARRAALVTSIAPHMTETLVGQVGLRPGKIFTSPWGCDRQVFGPRPDRELTGPVMVMHNRCIDSIYNWETLLRAIPLVRREQPDWRFIISDSGPAAEQMKLLVRQLGVEDVVEYVGWLDPRALAERLQKVDLYVSVALSDGNNISLNEAMACGAYPVVGDIPANRQWITDGTNGVLVYDSRSPAELAKRLLAYRRDDATVRRARQLNYEIVRTRADFAVNLGTIEQRYRQLLGRRR